ncbi:MAG: ParB/RepB/Spo0J family partition protein [Clostridia bacterium]|nr:ParB/RepB/Spo0J family partition protein [Clostridia bacterium]
MGGLGKGLGSLLGLDDLDDEVVATKKETKVETAVSDSKNDILYIDVNKIDVNPNQPRRTFDEESLRELSTSIKQYGVVQPILVRKAGNDRYMIVAGERRYRASRMVNLSTIPAIVREYTDAEVKEIALLENIQRQDLNPIETAKAMRELMDVYAWTQEELADRIGKSRSNVANTLRLLNLSDGVLKLVEEGKLSSGHARALVVIDDEDIQLQLANLAVEEKITVRDIEQAVKELQKPYEEPAPAPKKKKETTTMSIEMQDLIEKMQRRFATKVSVKGNDKKGQIIIEYYNTDDLDRLFQIIDNM